MSKTTYAHLLKSVVAAQSAAKDVTENNEGHDAEHTPPADDKEDNKKSKGKKAKGKKASDEGEEEEEKEDRESDEGEEEEGEEDKKEKKERKNEDKEDKKGKKASASHLELEAARLEERLRCATIFQSKAASGRPQVAAQFAFHTDMSADSAIAIMENLPSEQPARGNRASLDSRMASVPSANVGSDVVENRTPENSAGVTEDQLKAMSPQQRALRIVNSARSLRNEEPLKVLPAA